jgi:hypothetical protein
MKTSACTHCCTPIVPALPVSRACMWHSTDDIKLFTCAVLLFYRTFASELNAQSGECMTDSVFKTAKLTLTAVRFELTGFWEAVENPAFVDAVTLSKPLLNFLVHDFVGDCHTPVHSLYKTSVFE